MNIIISDHAKDMYLKRVLGIRDPDKRRSMFPKAGKEVEKTVQYADSHYSEREDMGTVYIKDDTAVIIDPVPDEKGAILATTTYEADVFRNKMTEQ